MIPPDQWQSDRPDKALSQQLKHKLCFALKYVKGTLIIDYLLTLTINLLRCSDHYTHGSFTWHSDHHETNNYNLEPFLQNLLSMIIGQYDNMTIMTPDCNCRLRNIEPNSNEPREIYCDTKVLEDGTMDCLAFRETGNIFTEHFY